VAQPLEFDWLKPSLLWDRDGLVIRWPDSFQPQLFEFRSDTFMEDFAAAAGSTDPLALEKALAKPPQADQALKLFLPVHGCFYLVCASLCCRQAGFPDRLVRVGEKESAYFVLRKQSNGHEYAWVTDGHSPHWQGLDGQSDNAPDGEERFPLLPVPSGNGRTLLAGYVPTVVQRLATVRPEDLAADLVQPGGTPIDLRIQELEARFLGPFKTYLAQRSDVDLRVSVYLLLELWEYIQTYWKDDVAAALQKDNLPETFKGHKADEKRALMQFLKTHPVAGAMSLAQALHVVAEKYDGLNQPGDPDLAKLGFAAPTYDLSKLSPTAFDGLLTKAKDALPDAAVPSSLLPKLGLQGGSKYVIRCVYERPQCEPVVRRVSQPSPPFTLAAHFDADAPVRPVQIVLPTDVSVAGLRKLKKGVTFVMSDAMRKKMQSLAGHEKSLLGDSPSLGSENGAFAFVCSFSIQIIFIVAFVLLMMFVVILNFVFWWIAFFKICLPIPKKLLPG
jgi:hypothetical protein